MFFKHVKYRLDLFSKGILLFIDISFLKTSTHLSEITDTFTGNAFVMQITQLRI